MLHDSDPKFAPDYFSLVLDAPYTSSYEQVSKFVPDQTPFDSQPKLPAGKFELDSLDGGLRGPL